MEAKNACTFRALCFREALGERSVFEVQTVDNVHTGIASWRYFWKKNGQLLGMAILADRENGYVAIRVLEDKESDNSILASLPDGEVVKLNRELVRRAGKSPNVPIGS